MATLSPLASLSCKCSSTRETNPSSSSKNMIKINGIPSMSTTKLDGLSHAAEKPPANPVAAATIDFASMAETGNVAIIEEHRRQNIPTKKQLVDPYRQGIIIEGGVGYRQTVVIRSYEVGADKTATLEAILNLLQETALNHVWMSGLLGDGFGATHGMMKKNLIWVVSRLHVQVDSYPIWGEVVEIDTWVGASGKNGMRRDWLVRSHRSGHVFARATSTWVMMNHTTRHLSKMPEEVRAEISPWFINKHAIQEDILEKIIKLHDNVKYVNSNLKPKRSDLDMNHHVNNVKYVGWMLETIPDLILESHQLSSIILEYRRECGSSDIVQSLCQADEYTIKEDKSINMFGGFSFTQDILEGHGCFSSFDDCPLRYTHLIQIKGESKNEEIVRGKTTWRKKLFVLPFST